MDSRWVLCLSTPSKRGVRADKKWDVHHNPNCCMCTFWHPFRSLHHRNILPQPLVQHSKCSKCVQGPLAAQRLEVLHTLAKLEPSKIGCIRAVYALTPRTQKGKPTQAQHVIKFSLRMFTLIVSTRNELATACWTCMAAQHCST